MPVKVKVWDLAHESGKIEEFETYAINAREIVQSDPKRFTTKKPDADPAAIMVRSDDIFTPAAAGLPAPLPPIAALAQPTMPAPTVATEPEQDDEDEDDGAETDPEPEESAAADQPAPAKRPPGRPRKTP